MGAGTIAPSKRVTVQKKSPNSYLGPARLACMGDRACYRDYCPACDAQVTIVDNECPECGNELATEDS